MGSIYNTTIAYEPGALTTCNCGFIISSAFRPTNSTEIQYPPPNSVLKHCHHKSYEHTGVYNSTSSNQAAYPTLSLHAELASLDPVWASCTIWRLRSSSVNAEAIRDGRADSCCRTKCCSNCRRSAGSCYNPVCSCYAGTRP